MAQPWSISVESTGRSGLGNQAGRLRHGAIMFLSWSRPVSVMQASRFCHEAIPFLSWSHPVFVMDLTRSGLEALILLFLIRAALRWSTRVFV